MCGILCLIEYLSGNASNNIKSLTTECEKQLRNRGPNAFNRTNNAANDQILSFSASVLWLQGETMSAQPLESPNSIFCFNGDVFGGDVIDAPSRLKSGDTTLFLQALERQNPSDNIINLLSKMQGPYAFLWYDKHTQNLYFGRDVFGRRSLLVAIEKYENSEQFSLLITSVATRCSLPCIELPAIGIFCYNLSTRTFKLFTWPHRHKNFDELLDRVKQLFECNIEVVGMNISINMSHSHEKFEFYPPNPKDLQVLEDLKSKSIENAFEYLLSNETWLRHVRELNTKLEIALMRRISTQPKFCKHCLNDKVPGCVHSRVGILFSGGVDCTILALIADKFIAENIEIDLLNVAFDKCKDYNTPDRITGRESLEELSKLRPNRKWNFVYINVPETELKVARQETIANLIFPLNTILDDSLGCALWFASRGRGANNYETPCRVLLVGMGADELFGGYTRHRAAFKNHGWQGLHDALEADWANIPHRNLARDDRVVADHGRQLRTPYLDEAVVEYIQSLKVCQKTYPSSDVAQGLGEKILLRTLAYHLGLRRAAGFRKRALQFGCRIADKNENAHQVSDRLRH